MRAKKACLWAFAGGIMLTFICSLSTAFAETYQDSREDGNWKVSWNLEAPESFQDELYQYQYVRQEADLKQFSEQLSPLLGERMALKTGTQNPSHLYADESMYNLGIPDFVSQEALPSAAEQTVIDSLAQRLEQCGFPCFAQPYVCATLETLRCDENDMVMGKVDDWASYQSLICGENTSAQPEKEDVFVVFAPQINGYPIVPRLIGDYSDSDIPMFALALIREDTLRYLDIGCAYEIKKEKPIEASPIDWKAAVRETAARREQMWRRAFDALAADQTEGFDYPSFFETYRPSYELEVKRVRACYYGNGKVLRPAYQIDTAVTVRLENAEALTEAEWHHYLPKVIRTTYVVDAITGEEVF